MIVSPIDLRRAWWTDPAVLVGLQQSFSHEPDADRATGYLFGDQPWPEPMAAHGPKILAGLEELTGVRFTYVAFQAYRRGGGCDWHADTPFDAQAILSLGAPAMFGVRPIGGEPEWTTVAHGDLVFMPPGFQTGFEHCVPVQPWRGERWSMVFRTPKK